MKYLIPIIILMSVSAGADPFDVYGPTIRDEAPIYFIEDFYFEWETPPIVRESPPDLNEYVFKLDVGILYFSKKDDWSYVLPYDPDLMHGDSTTIEHYTCSEEGLFVRLYLDENTDDWLRELMTPECVKNHHWNYAIPGPLMRELLKSDRLGAP